MLNHLKGRMPEKVEFPDMEVCFKRIHENFFKPLIPVSEFRQKLSKSYDPLPINSENGL